MYFVTDMACKKQTTTYMLTLNRWNCDKSEKACCCQDSFLDTLDVHMYCVSVIFFPTDNIPLRVW